MNPHTHDTLGERRPSTPGPTRLARDAAAISARFLRCASTAAILLASMSGWGSPALAQPIEPTYADVVYATVDGQPLHLDLYLPAGVEGPTPLVIWIHGGGWRAGDKYPLHVGTQPLLDGGFAVASINYRLTSDPNFPNRIFPAQIHDVKGAVRFLRAEAATYDLDPSRFGTWGGSAGGHLAALLGTSGGLADLEGDVGGNLEFSSLVQAAASFCGASDFWTQYPEDDAPDSGPSQLIGHALGDIKANVDNPNPPYPELVARMDAAGPITHVTSDDPPFFLAHGDEDDVVPPAQSADLAAALEAVGVSVSYHPIPGVGHGGPFPDDLAVEFFIAMLGDGSEVYQPRGVHDVDLLDSGNLLVTDGGTLAEPTTGGIYEIDRDGNILWSYTTGLNWAHNADKQPNGAVIISDTGNDRVIIVDQAGTIIWNSDDVVLSDGSTLHYPNDANLLPGGNLLITDRDNHRVIEIDAVGNIVWQHGQTGVPGAEPWRLNGPHNADRLVNGNTIIADSNNRRIVEVTPAGSIVWSYAVDLNWPRDADRLDDENTLINDSSNNRVIEVTPGGSIAWEYSVVGLSYDSDRLDNGNTLIGAGARIIEVDGEGEVVWSYPTMTNVETPVYVTLVSHNETDDARYGDYDTLEGYLEFRDAILQIADLVQQYDARWDFQSDWRFLEAVRQFDHGDVLNNTNGKNILRYLAEDLGVYVDVDAHSHESENYNYADVIYLIEDLGVTPNGVVGGFLYQPIDSPLVDWEKYHDPLVGWEFPEHSWQAEILWGGGTLYHQGEDDDSSGVWRISDRYHFYEHDPSSNLIHIGTGPDSGLDGPSGVRQLIQDIEDGIAPAGKIYTASVLMFELNVKQMGQVALDEYESWIQEIDGYVQQGKVQWANISEVTDIWQTEFDEQPNMYPYGSGNLLANSGFESGSGGQPDGWTTFSPTGATFAWDDTYSQTGDYSVKVEVPGAGIGMWQQVVDVSPGIVYTLAGYVSFENIVSPGYCNLEVVFRDAGNQIIEFVDLAAHDGTRPFELDFPYAMKFRTPDDAVTAAINCFLEGPGTAWFDDLFFGVAPAGSIAGVVTSGGQPLQGARVWISSDPFDKVYEAYTNEFGQYLLEDVPVAFPRYILLAEKAGYRTKPTGDVDVAANEVTTVDFVLIPGSDPLDDLRVKYGFLEQVDFAPPAQVPTDAVIPFDPAEYPASVQPYLASDAYITSDDPEIVALAQQILDSLAPADRNDTYKVTWAAYEWIVKNINHDGVFTNTTRDVTSGIYQTIQGGWCWGRSFYDWCYTPAETLAVKCVICVEHSWLASAVLRALNIPARARVGSAQFWVQKPGEYGYWVGLSTNGGSNAYREHGLLGSGFGGSPFPAFFSVTSEPFLAEDWNAQNKGLWRERHPWGENYSATPEGLAQVHADLDEFEATGEAPNGSGSPPGSDNYQVHYSDITVNLYNMGSQRLLDTRFPIVSESDTHHDMDRQAWWSNHPECITRTWIEEITNPPVEGVQRWFHIEFDLASLLGLGDMNCDGVVDFGDVNPFVLALTDQAAYETAYPDCTWHNADINRDGDADFGDINPFVGLLTP